MSGSELATVPPVKQQASFETATWGIDLANRLSDPAYTFSAPWAQLVEIASGTVFVQDATIGPHLVGDPSFQPSSTTGDDTVLVVTVTGLVNGTRYRLEVNASISDGTDAPAFLEIECRDE